MQDMLMLLHSGNLDAAEAGWMVWTSERKGLVIAKYYY